MPRVPDAPEGLVISWVGNPVETVEAVEMPGTYSKGPPTWMSRWKLVYKWLVSRLYP